MLREDRTLVFVEVKLRRGTGFGDPLEAVDRRKQEGLRLLTEQYLAEKDPDYDEVRFDVVGILERRDGRRLRHVRHAF